MKNLIIPFMCGALLGVGLGAYLLFTFHENLLYLFCATAFQSIYITRPIIWNFTIRYVVLLHTRVV
jgi:hypothetical protein